ncbi:hypothetical protein [Paramicrobacterium chengjingii]|uniref:hypothetical protein n=1 Tax=Paramicrobacterium chengjingii TaxID=2769067 RepID=UPI00141E9068|nr:hypothetical protein [Microbacterium chengjingii]
MDELIVFMGLPVAQLQSKVAHKLGAFAAVIGRALMDPQITAPRYAKAVARLRTAKQ